MPDRCSQLENLDYLSGCFNYMINQLIFISEDYWGCERITTNINGVELKGSRYGCSHTGKWPATGAADCASWHRNS
jgi:hypothetical protein